MMAPAGISPTGGETPMWIRRAAFAAFASAVLAAAVAPAVHAEPYSDTDTAYLAAMNHGKLCCPDQPDTPITAGGPDNQIQVGRSAAEYMTTYPTLRVSRRPETQSAEARTEPVRCGRTGRHRGAVLRVTVGGEPGTDADGPRSRPVVRQRGLTGPVPPRPAIASPSRAKVRTAGKSKGMVHGVEHGRRDR